MTLANRRGVFWSFGILLGLMLLSGGAGAQVQIPETVLGDSLEWKLAYRATRANWRVAFA